MPIFFVILFLCVSCSRYDTPSLPSFDNDKIDYNKMMQLKDTLQNKVKKYIKK